MDVTPREAPTAAAPRSRRRLVVPVVGVTALVVALGFVLANGLRDATVFFYNVDEAVQKRDEVGERRVRVQGNVVDGTVISTENGLDFTLTYQGEQLRVQHTGNPPDLSTWKAIPVVVEGSFEGDRFASDNILVRHDNSYDENNPDRVREAEADAQKDQASP